MDSKTIKKVFEQSADDLLKYNIGNGGQANVSVGVESYTFVGTNNLLLSLEEGIEDTVGATIYIEECEIALGKDVVTYTFYDRNSKTLGIEINNPSIVELIAGQYPTLHLEFDLRFLIENARDYYSEFGEMIGYPAEDPFFSDQEVLFPAKFSPSEQQREAVRSILNSRLSYVWGAPGTGKTQMVLATAIMAYLRKGSRIAIIAPTNNSVEQVLRGIIGVIDSDENFRRMVDPERDIARIGTATEQFIEDYPQLCEAQSIGGLISKMGKEADLLRDVVHEKFVDTAAANIHTLEVLSEEREKQTDSKTKHELDGRFYRTLSELCAIIETNEDDRDLVRDLTPSNFEFQIKVIKERLYKRCRPKNGIP